MNQKPRHANVLLPSYSYIFVFQVDVSTPGSRDLGAGTIKWKVCTHWVIMEGSTQATPAPAIAQWLLDRLEAALKPDTTIHYEATLYGPLNAYFNAYFPSSAGFIVKPQSVLLPGTYNQADEEQREFQELCFHDLDEAVRPGSPNSYGAHPGVASKGKKSPDFLVVKAGSSSLHRDKILLIVEVKGPLGKCRKVEFLSIM